MTLETHPAFKDAKIEFEKNVFTELNGKFNKKQFAEKIFNIFKEINDSDINVYLEKFYLCLQKEVHIKHIHSLKLINM